MHTYAYSSQQERVLSGAGAFGMHLLFIALLVFGVNWQKKVEPQANIVDLWTNLPSQTQPKVEPPPPPPPPQPVMPPKIEPAPPPKAVVKPDIARPDIALKENAEKQRRLIEQKQAEAKRREEEAKAEQKQQQQAKEAADAQRLAKEQEEDTKRKMAEQAAAAQAKLKNEYIERIRAKIRSRIVAPPNLQGNPRVEFLVMLLPNGEVLEVRTKTGSGNAAWDFAVERAIRAAQPLPLPPDPALAKDFRGLDLGFRPQD